jgi:DNA modification methylase
VSPTWQILQGDCIELMARLTENSVDSIVTDPPYGIGFMGKAWDHADIVQCAARRAGFAQPPDKNGDKRKAPRRALAEEAGAYDLSPRGMRAFHEFSRAWGEQALRLLKPGGWLLSFASTRTYHRMVCGLEEAGFEIRDQIGWLFGSGFPKSRNGDWGGTALKPAWEPVVLARKPLAGTVEKNWREHGTGALNIDACRVDGPGGVERAGEESQDRRYTDRGATSFAATPGPRGGDPLGRWPANVIHDGSEEVLAAFPDAPGQQAPARADGTRASNAVYGSLRNITTHPAPRDDGGSAARFFYCAKASRADRNAGLENPGPQFKHGATLRDIENAERDGNIHPTVKPTALMRYLVRLVTPAGGLVLDPFAGSGSTGRAAVLEGMCFIGMDNDTKHGYVEIARARIAAAEQERAEEQAAEHAASAQIDLFAEQQQVGHASR